MINSSFDSYDQRSITRIIYEKATFGAPPTHYRVEGDPRWHPVAFAENKHLTQVQFADGSISTIYVPPEENGPAPEGVEDNGDNIPWPTPLDTEVATSAASDADYVRNHLDNVVIDDMSDALAELARKDTSELEAKSLAEIKADMLKSEDAARTARIARMFAPDQPTAEPNGNGDERAHFPIHKE